MRFRFAGESTKHLKQPIRAVQQNTDKCSTQEENESPASADASQSTDHISTAEGKYWI